jgi:hypothetical protein
VGSLHVVVAAVGEEPQVVVVLDRAEFLSGVPARADTHTGEGVYARSYTVPRAARPSIAGVTANGRA